MMKNFKHIWLIGLGVTFLIVALPITLFTSNGEIGSDNPWQFVPVRAAQTSHESLINGTLKTGSDVTTVCLSCHTDAAHEVMQTTHWTWKSETVFDAKHGKEIAIGKSNLLNNFCIGIQSNWQGCTKCHAGYGWKDASFDFTSAANVDCLVCHEQTGTYVKSTAGVPADSVDLLAVARSVGIPTRQNCGSCHFNGGGGNGVKHGDLDESLYFPTENLDVHMGKYNFQCVDCHQTTEHQIKGRALSVSPTNTNQAACTDCHNAAITHTDSRITAHIGSVACQTCHIPAVALRDPTKMEWDWSTAGQDRPENQHEYLKIKGSFIYEKNVTPQYVWHNGTADHYLLGDVIDPSKTTVLNPLHGGINDPSSLLWPFKVHQARQPYDAVYNYLLQPKTVGEYWVNFDWDQAFEAGSKATGLAYSGQYGFAATEMYWPLTHMVAPASNALQCTSCHGENGRLDWAALGYKGDPMVWGGRSVISTVPTAIPVGR